MGIYLSSQVSTIKPTITNKKKNVDIVSTSRTNCFNKLSFKARPWDLPDIPINNSYDAIVAYNFLKIGNYLDSSDDDVSFDNKNIRDKNLKFLDSLTTNKDKKEFIEYYKDITGFPNLEKVSQNIEREFILGIKKSSIGIDGAECIAAGYDSTCSVGKRRAFPGSDLDKAFIILKGSPDNNPDKDNQILDNFKANLWNNIDQRILSFNHDISFPSIYTSNQVINTIKEIDKKTQYLYIDKTKFDKLMDEEYVNLEAASKYNLEISKNFTIDKENHNLSKEEVKNFGYFIEPVRDGKFLIKTPQFEDLKNEIEDYDFYKYSNVAQTRAMKKAVNEGRENKNKIRLRENMVEKFNSWDTDTQFKFIKTLIKYSCEDNKDFEPYFKNDRNVKDAYKPLLNQLTRGDLNTFNRPEFSKIESGLKMKYTTDKTINLYQGYDKNILWIDSDDSQGIKETTRQINKIKQCELFSNINKIQCPKPDSYIKGFYPIQYKTLDDKTIYEKDLSQ
ncbi:MAG: hypothetical protein ACI4S3_02135 [Candidatus Gastranaerophilaceae bacterium]